MVKKESNTWPEIDRIEDEIEIYDQYIENLQKKCDKWKGAWEAAEKRSGELQRELKGERRLHELEIGELQEASNHRLKLLEEILKWHRNYHRLLDLEPIIEKVETEVIKAMAKEYGAVK